MCAIFHIKSVISTIHFFLAQRDTNNMVNIQYCKLPLTNRNLQAHREVNEYC